MRRLDLNEGGREARRLLPEPGAQALLDAVVPHSLLESKPPGTAARTEVLFVGAQRDGWLVVGSSRTIGIGEEVHVHAADPPRAELDVARACPFVSHRDLLVSQARNQCCCDGARGALGEYAGLRCALFRAVADGVNVRKARFE